MEYMQSFLWSFREEYLKEKSLTTYFIPHLLAG